MLPTGTALAATPAPAPSSAAPAQDPAPAPDPTTSAPEPSATTDPTPAPTVEPPPNPTPPSTTEACPALPLTPLGATGAPEGSVTLGANEETCFTVTAEQQGLHRVMRDGAANIHLTFFSGATQVSCERDEADEQLCPLSPGTYTVRVRNHAWADSLRFSVIPLTPGPSCPEIPGTGYDTAPATGPGTGRLGLVCHTFHASAGDRITTELRSGRNYLHHWITDDTGRRICPASSYDGLPGCILPQGAGGYRVIGDLSRATDPAAEYRLLVRRLSNPEGCTPITPTAYGTAAVQASPPSGCRSFTPQVSRRYEARSLDTNGWETHLDIYHQDGRSISCTLMNGCVLTAGVTYAFISDDLVELRDRASAEGCTEDLALSTLYHGTLTGLGETDCLTLPAPQGSSVVLRPDDAVHLSVLDATGREVCSYRDADEDSTCTLTGTAPHRLLVTSARTSAPTGAYRIRVDRADMPGDCRVLPSGDFTDDTPRADLTTGDGVFNDCLTIPAADHSARELLQLRRTAGERAAGLVVFDASGKWACSLRAEGSSAQELCGLAPGVAHTVFFQGHDAPATYALVRQDVTATAKGCPSGPAAPVGGPSLDGLPGPVDVSHCHQVTAAATDRLHLTLRGAGDTVRFVVYDANGVEVCTDSPEDCAPTGSTRYQAVVTPNAGTALPSHHIDALRIGTGTVPAPECVRLSDVSHGFGPLTDELSEQKSALCAVLPTAASDAFTLDFSSTGTYATWPKAWLYDIATGRNTCQKASGYWSPEYSCAPQGDTKASFPTTLVIGLPDRPTASTTPIRAEAGCIVAEGVCGLVPWTVTSVTPGTVGAGKITMTVTGTSLSSWTRVVVEEHDDPYAYFYGATSTTVSVAPDRRSMVVALDLTGAPVGHRLSLRVDSGRGVEYRPAPITITAPLASTGVPAITGTVVVGGKVTASPGPWSPVPDGYAYQWKADGVAISGATASTYTIPTALQGKQLTVTLTARKAGHPNATATTRPVVVKGVAPRPTTVPYMSGAVRVGGKVTAVVGAWSPTPTSYAYQWRANGVAISGATGSSYVPVPAVLGKKLTVTVTALRTGHLSGAYTTAGVAVALGLAPKATSAPYLTGTVRVGRTLTLNRGAWTPAPTSYAYQWYASGRAISGATRTTYTLTSAQRGLRITVRVTALRTGHTSGVAWTRATGAVAG
ncbi:hypothetical protein [Streptomyces sp. NK15101]|uniref:hypothetical protein n=1 Tax=Streptomyces sp. NK15101 TaxID=2873261 RepID=UPI001CEDC744|nr:hypothetical protein [Streptomyces sp. NK15101]